MPSQTNSAFAPGLTVRGPVYNSLGALPSFMTNLPPWAIVAAIAAGAHFAAKHMHSKLPYAAGAVAAFLYWKNNGAMTIPSGTFVLPDGTPIQSSLVTEVGTTGTQFAYGGQTYNIVGQAPNDANGGAIYNAQLVAQVIGG